MPGIRGRRTANCRPGSDHRQRYPYYLPHFRQAAGCQNGTQKGEWKRKKGVLELDHFESYP